MTSNQQLDLEAIRQRHADAREALDAQDGADLEIAAAEAIDDVPALLAEIARLTAGQTASSPADDQLQLDIASAVVRIEQAGQERGTAFGEELVGRLQYDARRLRAHLTPEWRKRLEDVQQLTAPPPQPPKVTHTSGSTSLFGGYRG